MCKSKELILEPCPFCGHEAVYDSKKVRIFCTACSAEMRGRKDLKKYKGYIECFFSVWNRRQNNK